MSASSESHSLKLERRFFLLPPINLEGKGEEIFRLQFDICLEQDQPAVNLSIRLNPNLLPLASRQPILEFPFEHDRCEFHAVFEAGYFVQGKIGILYLSQPTGEFFQQKCNFVFDLTYGEQDLSPHSLIGLYKLIHPTGAGT